MDRIMLEQSGVGNLPYRRDIHLRPSVRNTTSHHRVASGSSRADSPPSSSSSSASSPSQTLSSQVRDYDPAVMEPHASPAPFYTAKHLYHEHLHHHAAAPHGIRQDVLSLTKVHDNSSPPSLRSHSITSSPNRMTTLKSRAAKISPLSPTPVRQRSVPAPTTYEVLADATTQTRYPTPPWWRRVEDDDTAKDENAGVAAMLKGVQARSSEQQVAARSKTTNDGRRQGPEDSESDEETQAHRDDQPEALFAASSSPTAALPPPSRSRTRSADNAQHHSRHHRHKHLHKSDDDDDEETASRTPHRASTPSLSPFPTGAAATRFMRGESPVQFVNPQRYRAAGLRATLVNDLDVCVDGVGNGDYPVLPSPDTVHNTPARTQTQIPSEGFRFYRDASVASSGTVATSLTTTTATTTTSQSTRRHPLRIYEESAAHPSGFSVPRRGAGQAAPRRLYNDLAVLPAAVADRSAVDRAASAAGCGGALLYGTSNFPSHCSLRKYREGVAMVTGVDPAHLRDGALHQRYSRPHSGWVERVKDEAGDRSVTGMQWTHTTTRLRRGMQGGGAPRAMELLDPVSGLPRKPNEVPASFFLQTSPTTAALMAARPPLTGETHSMKKEDERERVVHSSRAREQRSHANEDGREAGRWEEEENGRPSRSSAHVQPSRAQRLCDLAAERRSRATARSSRLPVTHRANGLALSEADRRLYWAEHAALHRSDVRGLNALLQGVGEAEPGEGEEDECGGGWHAGARAPSSKRSWTGSESSGVEDAEKEEGRWEPAEGILKRGGERSQPVDDSHIILKHDSADMPSGGSRAAFEQKRAPNSSSQKDAPRSSHTIPSTTNNNNKYPDRKSDVFTGAAEVDAAQAELQRALRQRRGVESTLTASAILPAAYRRESSSGRGRDDDGSQDENARRWPLSYSLSEDDPDAELTTHEAAIRNSGGQRQADKKRDATFSGNRNAGNRSMGLVDSYLLHSTAGVSEVGEDRMHGPHDPRRSDDSLRQHQHHHRGTSWRSQQCTTANTVNANAMNYAAETQRVHRRVNNNDDDDDRVGHSIFHAALLFPPMLTPLLQEVDECLRFHNLPTTLSMWRWPVAEQTALLRSAGFSAAECKTIVWELERMIRATSTRCAVAV